MRGWVATAISTGRRRRPDFARSCSASASAPSCSPSACCCPPPPGPRWPARIRSRSSMRISAKPAPAPGSSTTYSPDLGGFTTQTSVDLGESVTLKIGRDAPVSSNKTVDIAVYRMGYYDGDGGRLVNSATNVPINNDFTCKADERNDRRGRLRQLEHRPTRSPAAALPASGVYIAKLTASSGEQTAGRLHRPRRRPRARLEAPLRPADRHLPGLQHLRRQVALLRRSSGGNTVSGTSRAVKVSFNRPFDRRRRRTRLVLRPRLQPALLARAARATTSPTPTTSHLHQDPASAARARHARRLRPLRVLVAGAVQRRQGGPRRRRQHRLLQRQHRLLEGPLRGRQPHPRLLQDGRGQTAPPAAAPSAANDWGPDGVKGTADDALGLDGKAGTADDNPQNSTTTFRDNGAPPGDPDAPPGGRVGPDMPENQLFGIMYVGDNDGSQLPAHDPAGQRQRRIRRRPHLAQHRHLRERRPPTSAPTSSAGSGTRSRPRPSTSRQPADGVKRLYVDQRRRPPPTTPGSRTRDALRNTSPRRASRARQRRQVHRAQRRPGLRRRHDAVVPRALHRNRRPRIEQATYNIFSDMGAQPVTPEDITLDPGGSNQAPTAPSRSSPNPAKTDDQRSPSTPPSRTTPTARSPNTSGTSTATATSRPTAAPKPTRRPTATRPRAPTTCACGSPTTAAPPTSPCAP